MWRSLLFVPILNERLVGGASKRGADAIVLDLEAAVPRERKSEAREALPTSIADLQCASSDIAVRVNALEDGGQGDIEIALALVQQVALREAIRRSSDKKNTKRRSVRPSGGAAK